jgi:AraC-like DNA-binding protein
MLAEIAEQECAASPFGFELRDDRVFGRDREFRSLLDSYLARATSRGAPPTALEMDARATLLGIHLVRHHSSSAANANPRPAGLDRRTLARAMEFIDSKARQNLSLAEIAGAMGLSPHYFCTAFMRSTGIPPHRYLLQRRIDQAKPMLAGGASIAEVALECGFSSQSHFTTVFRRFAGMPPAAWRKAHNDRQSHLRKI